MADGGGGLACHCGHLPAPMTSQVPSLQVRLGSRQGQRQVLCDFIIISQCKVQFVWVSPDSSIQGFCYQLPDLSTRPGSSFGSQGAVGVTVPVQGLAHRSCPVHWQRTCFIAGLLLTPSDSILTPFTRSHAHGQDVMWGDRDNPDSALILRVLPVWPGRAKWTVCYRADGGQPGALGAQRKESTKPSTGNKPLKPQALEPDCVSTSQLSPLSALQP